MRRRKREARDGRFELGAPDCLHKPLDVHHTTKLAERLARVSVSKAGRA